MIVMCFKRRKAIFLINNAYNNELYQERLRHQSFIPFLQSEHETSSYFPVRSLKKYPEAQRSLGVITNLIYGVI